MKLFNIKSATLVAALAAAFAAPAHAAIAVTEVAPWASGSSPYAQDWFELTNTSASAVNISGWKMDDNSNSFASAVAMRGVTSIAAGQSVVFIEDGTNAANDAALDASFISTWFGASAPAGLTIANYGGSGVGLGTTGDAVNIYNASGVLQANVSFGASPAGPSFPTFDNAAGLNNTTISQLSVVGTNGAFVAANDIHEIGSPGTIAAVPEPETYGMIMVGLGVVSLIVRRERKAG